MAKPPNCGVVTLVSTLMRRLISYSVRRITSSSRRLNSLSMPMSSRFTSVDEHGKDGAGVPQWLPLSTQTPVSQEKRTGLTAGRLVLSVSSVWHFSAQTVGTAMGIPRMPSWAPDAIRHFFPQGKFSSTGSFRL
jgi:hypothetical protein